MIIDLNKRYGATTMFMNKKDKKNIPGQERGHYISGVQTEEGNHKNGKRYLHGKRRPDLDALEAGDPFNNAIDWSTEFLDKLNK